MSEVNLSKLKKLFQEKKYSEIVMDIELKTTENDRSPALHNLLIFSEEEKDYYYNNWER